MRHSRWLMVLGCWAMVSGAAWGATAAHPTPHPAKTGPADAAHPAGVHRKLERSAAEVARLKHDVAEQEARSHQANQRLHEQDQALAELRRQLQAVEQGGAASGHNP